MKSNSPSVDLQISGSIAKIILSNEEHRNAMTRTMWSQLAEHCTALASSRDIRAVVIEGKGTDAFASGADISEFGESRRTADQTAAYHETIQTALDAITAIPCPVIARIHGFCIGAGTAIALTCGMRTRPSVTESQQQSLGLVTTLIGCATSCRSSARPTLRKCS